MGRNQKPPATQRVPRSAQRRAARPPLSSLPPLPLRLCRAEEHRVPSARRADRRAPACQQRSVGRSEAAVRVHTGSWEGDLAQVARLGEHPRLEVTAHDVDGHRVTARLNAEDALLDILRGAVEAEVAALPRAPAP